MKTAKKEFVLLVNSLEEDKRFFLSFNTQRELDKAYKDTLEEFVKEGIVEVLQVMNPEKFEWKPYKP